MEKAKIMKILIVEDDFTSRVLMLELLKKYGECHVAVNGKDALDLCRAALEDGKFYDLICLDIMMPEMDGLTALKEIRDMEENSKIIMVTALNNMKFVMESFHDLCNGYVVKPVDKDKIHAILKDVGLVG